MKVIFNYATRQFEPMEPSMRERFALGGGVIHGEKVGDRENFARIRTGQSAGIGMQRKAAANKKRFFEVLDKLIAGEIKLGENVKLKNLNPDLRTGSLAIQTLAANSGIQSRSNMRLFINQHPWYKQNKNIWKYATKVLSGDFKGKTYAHYSLPDEIDAEIELIDRLILDYQKGKSPMIRTKQELLEAINEQNKKRAQYVKIRNEIAPEDTKVKPGDELLETAEVTPIKQEGIISDVDLKTDKGPKTLEGVELYGDETFDELRYISEYGVHPRDLDPTEGFAKGGIVSLT